MKVAILAEAPAALIELCGVSMLERLLRTLQRVGVPEVVIVSSTAEALEEELARPSPISKRDYVDHATAPGGAGENRGNSRRRLGRRVARSSCRAMRSGTIGCSLCCWRETNRPSWLIPLRRHRSNLSPAECRRRRAAGSPAPLFWILCGCRGATGSLYEVLAAGSWFRTFAGLGHRGATFLLAHDASRVEAALDSSPSACPAKRGGARHSGLSAKRFARFAGVGARADRDISRRAVMQDRRSRRIN